MEKSKLIMWKIVVVAELLSSNSLLLLWRFLFQIALPANFLLRHFGELTKHTMIHGKWHPVTHAMLFFALKLPQYLRVLFILLKNKLAIIYELSEIKIFIRIILNQHRYIIQDDEDGVFHAKSIC